VRQRRGITRHGFERTLKRANLSPVSISGSGVAVVLPPKHNGSSVDDAFAICKPREFRWRHRLQLTKWN
jgi:hypothetical protein